MNLKNWRAVNRAERRRRMAEARSNLEGELATLRITTTATPSDLAPLKKDIERCRNFGDLHHLRTQIRLTESLLSR